MSERNSIDGKSFTSEDSIINDVNDQHLISPQQQQHHGRQTGVKGVIADAAHFEKLQKQEKYDKIKAKNDHLNSLAPTSTWKEDSKIQKLESEYGVKPGQLKDKNTFSSSDEDSDEELQKIRQLRLESLKGQAAANESRRKKLAGELQDGNTLNSDSISNSNHFGHLREIGPSQFTQAIDNENSSTFIVVHIYVKYVHSCAMLTSALSQLARMNPSIKFLQVRAGSIGFGSGGAGGGKMHDQEKDDDEEDEFFDDDEEILDEKAEDIVPTLLIYKGGEIHSNLVRVDLDEQWKNGTEQDICNLLKHYKVL